MALPRGATCALATGLAVGSLPLALALQPGRSPARVPGRDTAAHRARTRIADLPLAFEVNRGQTDPQVRYLARGAGYTLFLTDRESVLALERGKRGAAVLRTRFRGTAATRTEAEHRLPGVVNVYRGQKSAWRTGIQTFAGIRYRSVYPGIDAVYHGRKGRLEYDFELQPRADAARIELDLGGARKLSLSRTGDLLISLPGGTLRELRPRAYQMLEGRRVAVALAYALRGGRVGFRVGRYDHARQLVIDPVLTYSSYLGGSAADVPEKIAVGGDGTVYVTGYTASNDFPSGTGSGSTGTDHDAFVTHLSSAGNSILYSTYIGGNSDDEARDVAPGGAYTYVAGQTSSGAGFPGVTDGTHPAVDSCGGGGTDAWFARLNSGGGVAYASCLSGGSDDIAYSLTVRSVFGGAQAYIVGSTRSTDMPTGTNAGFQASKNTTTSARDGFLTKVTFTDSVSCGSIILTCVGIAYATYMGGSDSDTATSVAPDPTAGNVVAVAGDTLSTDFPATGGSAGGGDNAFVVRVNTANSGSTSESWGTLFGGGLDDSANGVAVSSSGDVYFVGSTYSTDLPGNTIAIGNNLQIGILPDGYIGHLSSSGAVACSSCTTYVGGGGSEELNDIALKEVGGTTAEYVVGYATGDFTTLNGISGQSCSSGDRQVLLVKAAVSLTKRGVYMACVGGSSADGDSGNGIAVDPSGGVWITGDTGAFPLVDPLQSPYGGGQSDGFVAHVEQTRPALDSGPSGIVSTSSPSFAFSTDEQNMTFNCTTPAATLVAGSRSACTSPMAYSGLSDGPQTFEVTTADTAGGESVPTTRTFTVDTTPPSGFDLTGPGDGATTGTRPAFSWTDSSDANGVSGYRIVVDGNKLQDVPESACGGGTCSATAASPLLGGKHTWNVTALDNATPANTTPSTSTRSFTVSDPPTARLTIAPNPALTGRTVNFNASASADATHTITTYEWDLDGDGSFEANTGGTATTTHSYSKAGTYNVGLRVTDSAGQVGTTTFPLKITDLTSPSGTPIGVSINRGAQYTNDPDVTLAVVAPSTTTSMLVANDGGFMDAKTFLSTGKAASAAVAGPVEIPWKLDSAGPERLPKTVYVRFLIGTFASPNYTDDIILDTRPPVVQQASIAPAAGAASAARAARLATWKVHIKAKDDNSGVGSVQVTANKRKPGKKFAYKKSLKVKAAKRPAFVRARDKAGNFSRWKKIR